MLPKQSISFPEVAIIRKGSPKQIMMRDGKALQIQGKDLADLGRPVFRINFEPGTEKARASWDKTHAKDLKQYDPTKFVLPDGYEVARLKVIVPTSNIWQAVNDDGAVNEAYNAGRRIARANDEKYIEFRDPADNWKKTVNNGEPFKKFTVGDKIIYDRNGKTMEIPVKTNVRLRLVAADMIAQGELVQFTLKTTSWYDWQNIKNQLAGIQGIADAVNGGNASGVAFEIYRMEQDIVWNKPNGEAVRMKKWLINIQPDPEWVKAAFARMSQFALTGGTIAGALMPKNEIAGVANPEVEEEDTEGEIIPETEGEPVIMSYDQASHVIVPTINGAERFMSELSVDNLNKIYLSDKASQEQKDAAAIVLKHDFSLEPPTA